MRHQCKQCNLSSFSVVKTWPYEDYTLRQLKCQHCGANVFSCEYLMEKDEYQWKRDNNTKKSWIDLR